MGTKKLGDLCAWQQMLEAYIILAYQELLKLGVPEALNLSLDFVINMNQDRIQVIHSI